MIPSPIPKYCAKQIIEKAEREAAEIAIKAFKQTVQITGSFAEANQTAGDSWKQAIIKALPELLQLEIEINYDDNLKLDLNSDEEENLQVAVLLSLKLRLMEKL